LLHESKYLQSIFKQSVFLDFSELTDYQHVEEAWKGLRDDLQVVIKLNFSLSKLPVEVFKNPRPTHVHIVTDNPHNFGPVSTATL